MRWVLLIFHDFGIANAIGSAISKVSGTYEKLVSYDEVPRDEALENAREEASSLAVAAGAPILVGTILVIATYVIIDLAFSEWEVSEKVVGALNSATTE